MRSLVKALLWIGGIFGVIGGVVYFIWLDAWTIPSDDSQLTMSIAPTVTAGDFLLLTRDMGAPLGDLVRCADPRQNGRYVLARVIASGMRDEVEVNAGFVRVNGQREPSPRGCDLPHMTLHDPRTGGDVDVQCSIEEIASSEVQILYTPGSSDKTDATVDPGHVYLVSDDRTVHEDSRDFGQVDPNTCQHVLFRMWSAQGFGDSAHRFNVLW